MCLIITGQKTDLLETLTPSFVNDTYRINPDGVGIMWADKGIKSMFNTPKATRNFLLKKLKEANDEELIAIHFRMATHGTINYNNAHPILVPNRDSLNNPLLLMHNGILFNSLPDPGEPSHLGLSDTMVFIKYHLAPFSTDTIIHPGFCSLISKAIGKNVMVLSSRRYGILTINSDLGVFYNKVWYSNLYAWKPPADVFFETFSHLKYI